MAHRPELNQQEPEGNLTVEPSPNVPGPGKAVHDDNRAWFFANPQLWPEYQNQVVAVFDKTVLGAGDRFTTAYQAAKDRCAADGKPCPDPYDVTFVVVPVVFPDLPEIPDWDFGDTVSE